MRNKADLRDNIIPWLPKMRVLMTFRSFLFGTPLETRIKVEILVGASESERNLGWTPLFLDHEESLPSAAQSLARSQK